LKALDILARSSRPFFGPDLNLMWLLGDLRYRCQLLSLRFVFVATFLPFETVSLTALTERSAEPSSSLSSSRVPSIRTKCITLSYR